MSADQQQDDFIFDVENKVWPTERPKGHPKPETYDEIRSTKKKKEVEARKLEDQISATTSSIKEKKIHDSSRFYYVIEADVRAGQGLYAALRELSAKVHAYLDREHSVLLVSSSADKLESYSRRGLPFLVKAPLLKIRVLRVEEQISEDINTFEGEQLVVLHLIPNLSPSQLVEYSDMIEGYLSEMNTSVAWQSTALEGMMVAQMDRARVLEILGGTNLVFKAHLMPLGIVESAHKRRRHNRSRTVESSAVLSSVETKATESIPTVCVVDSGVTIIPPLNGLVIERKKLSAFSTLDDEHEHEGHGTPIACLVSYGENGGTARARIVSYKIYSDSVRNLGLRGVEEALTNYGTKVRIFVSSVNFVGNALPTYAKLDGLIQQLNICYVSAAGNITPTNRVLELAVNYPTYIESFPVQHIGQNVHVIGVGAIANLGTANTIAPRDAVSPFTTCGKTLDKLYEVAKPDIVEHGGNLAYDGQSVNVGVTSFDKHGVRRNSFAGTSFAAPLIAGRLAEIEAKYGHRIRNSETLKAILFMSSRKMQNNCTGLGVPQRFLTSKLHQATFVTEGEIPLSDLTTKGKVKGQEHRVSIFVPSGVKRIRMCLVHSDNYHDVVEPTLDTYFRLRVTKTGHRKGSIDPDEGRPAQNAQTYVKLLSWSFARKDMEGEWRFDLLPESVKPIAPEIRKATLLRYGCVITLENPNPGLISLTRQVRKEMNRRVRG